MVQKKNSDCIGPWFSQTMSHGPAHLMNGAVVQVVCAVPALPHALEVGSEGI